MLRQPKRGFVKLREAQGNILFLLVSFALSVTGTRLYLDITGYPQIGNELFHIAHALWGGLLLFAGALLPLIFANYYLHRFSAILIGFGAGLFVDEVGKFITQTNDYFSPLAAPIIYVCFLLTIMVYLSSRYPDEPTPRNQIFDVLVHLQEVVDQDVDDRELAQIQMNLSYLMQQRERPDIKRLAQVIGDYLQSDELILIPHKPTIFERIYTSWQVFDEHYIGQHRYRITLYIIFSLLALYGLSMLFMGVALIVSSQLLELLALEVVPRSNLVQGSLSFSWYIVAIFLEGFIGLLFVLAMIVFTWRRDNVATRLGVWGLVMYLSTVGIINFYFSQFQTILLAALFFVLLLLTLYYRRQYLGILDKSLPVQTALTTIESNPLSSESEN